MKSKLKFSSIIALCLFLLSCSAQESHEKLEETSLSKDRILKTAIISGAYMQKNKDEIEKEEDKKKKRKAGQQPESPGFSSGNEGQDEIAN